MNRRSFIKSSGAAAAAAILVPAVPALAGRSRTGRIGQTRQKGRTGQTGHGGRALFTPVRRGTGTFEGRGGTIGWLVSDEALVLVDTQFPESAAECWEGIQIRSSRRIDFLINSHHHGDHTAGNPVLATHAEFHLAHENVPVLQKAASERSNNSNPQVYAQLLFSSEMTQEIGDETIRMKYYGPAHTGGDAITHFVNADVVHTGDLVFNRVPAYIDLAGGSDTEKWIGVLESIYADFTDDTIFIYGHGHPDHGITGTRNDVLEARDFLTALREHVLTGIAAGKSEDELLVNTLPGFTGYLNPDRPTTLHGRIRSVYTELSGSE